MSPESIEQLVLPTATNVDGVVVFGYSSKRSSNPNRVEPSRLSRMAFDMGQRLCRKIGEAHDSDPHLILVTEQTFDDIEHSTAQAYIDDTPGVHNFGSVPDYHDNNLRNTRMQSTALEAWLRQRQQSPQYAERGFQFVMLGYGFHWPRIKRAFDTDSVTPRQFTHVEDLLDELYDDGAPQFDRFAKHYDMRVTWPVVKERGLPHFHKREARTLWLDKVGDGALINLLSRNSTQGRIDDIDAFGNPITQEPRFNFSGIARDLGGSAKNAVIEFIEPIR